MAATQEQVTGAAVEQETPAEPTIIERVQTITGVIAALQAQVGEITSALRACQDVIDADEPDEEALMGAISRRKALRADLAARTGELATASERLKALGQEAIAPLVERVKACKGAFEQATGKAIADLAEAPAMHAALDTLVGAQRDLDALRASLGIEPEKPKGTRTTASGETRTQAAPGQVYVTREGNLSVYLGPEAGEGVIATLRTVKGAVLTEKRFQWGERKDSWDIVIAKDMLKQVREACIKARDLLPADAAKEVRRGYAKLVKQTAHVAEGGETQLRV